MKIVATTSLPAVDRPNADRWNAARSRQLIFNHEGGTQKLNFMAQNKAIQISFQMI